MLHPVGSRPPSTYWRRRLLVLASVVLLVILIVLTVRALLSDGGGSASGSGPQPPPTSGHASTTPTPTPTATTSDRPSSSGTSSGTTSTSTTTPPAKCTPAQLKVQAVVGKAQYKIGDQPVLTLQVTNAGRKPCVQNVADSQIVLRVYNGASRVWGSHDCQTQPGVDDRTLPVGKAIGFSIVWSGLTAQPGCAGTRQRVGAGTYTLYAALSGHDGKAAQFTIS